MTPQELKSSILQLAVQGKLVEQRPEEGTAEELYQQIQAEKQRLIKEGKIKKEKPLPEITEDEIPFDIPESWKWVRLGDIGETNIGLTYRPSDKTTVGGVLVLRSSNIQNNKMCYDDNVYVSCDIPERAMIHKGDILICARNGSRSLVGKSAIVDCDGMAFGAFMAKYSSKCNYFIKLFLDSPVFRHQLDGVKTETINQITQDMLKKQLLPLPPLVEQKRIVAKIEELLPYIDRYEKAWSRLEEFNKRFPDDMQKSVLQMAIQGKLVEQRPEEGTGEELYQQIQEEKQRLIKEGKIKKEKPLPEISEDEIPFDIPESWKWVRLDDLVIKSIKRGKAPKYSAKSNTLVFAQKCNTKKGEIDLTLAKFLDDAVLSKYPNEEYLLNNDIVVNSTGHGTLGRVGLFSDVDNCFDYRIVPDSHITVIRSSRFMFCRYLFFYLKSQQTFLEHNAEGSTNQTELKPEIIKCLFVPLPPLAEQKRIVEKLEEILPLCEKLK